MIASVKVNCLHIVAQGELTVYTRTQRYLGTKVK